MSTGTRARSIVVVAALALLATLLSPLGAGAVPVDSPANLAPDGTVEAVNPQLSWDPVVGALSYRVQVSTVPDFSVLKANQQTYNTSYIPPSELPAGDVYWRVAAIDGTGTGPYANAQFVKSLTGPTLVEPADGEVLDFPTEPPTFRWSAIDAAKGYILEIDDAEDFITPTATITTKGTVYTFDQTQQVGQPYYWRVRGDAGGGVLTAWSETHSYEVSWATVPQLLTPPNDTLVPVIDPLFTWDPVPGAARYEIEFSRSIDFNEILQTRSDLVATTYRQAEALLPGSYWWRVRAIDDGDHIGPWSDTHAFTIGGASAAPAGPDPIYPVSVDPVTPVDAPDPVWFEWTPVFRASHYQIWVDDDSGFGSPTSCETIQTKVWSHTGDTAAPGGCGVFPLDYDKTYYWKVRGVDDTVTGPDRLTLWSEVNAFRRTPAVVVLTSPAPDATVSVPVLTWEPVNDADRYKVRISRPDGTPVETITTYSTSAVPTNLLTVGTTYRWSVVPIHVDGKEPSAPTPNRSFTVAAIVGGTDLDPLTPDGAPASLWMPTMQWSPITNANRYQVQQRPLGTAPWITLEDNLKYPAFAARDAADWLVPGTYEWRVNAFTGATPLDTSDTATFAVSTFDPPVYLSPDVCPPGGVGCDQLTSVPELSWEPRPGAKYTVHVAYDALFQNQARQYTVRQSRFVPREELADNNVGQAYFWYVRSCRPGHCTTSPAGVAVPSGAWQRRSEPVQLLSPPDAIADPSTPRPDADPTFVWRDYLDMLQNLTTRPADDLEAATYTLTVSQSATFQGANVDSVVTDYESYTPSTKTYPEGPLYWKVKAKDASGTVLTESATWLTIKESPRITLVNPADGATVSAHPTFQWEPQDGAVRYELEVYRNGDLLWSPANEVTSAGRTTPHTSWTPAEPLPLGTYAWRVRRTDTGGQLGPWSDGRLFTVGPTVIDLLSPAEGALLLDNDIVFDWTADTDPASYRFQYSSSPLMAGPTNVTTVVSRYAATNKFADGIWYWRVQAFDAANNMVGESEIRSFERDTQLPPGAPRTVTAVAGDAQATVSWQAPTTDGGTPITGYTVTSSPDGATCATAGELTCTVTGLTNGTEYTFTVIATNIRGDSPPSAPSAPVTPATVPDPPTDVTGVRGNTSVTVSWVAPAWNGGLPVGTYTVTASPGGATCTTAALSCTVSGLVNGTPYTFTVTASNPRGTSAPSAPSAAVTPMTVPGPPTAVTAVRGNTQATVSWTAPASNGGSAITAYTVTSAPGGLTCATAGATTCVVTGLTNGTSYTFTVRATNEVGQGPASTASTAVVPATTPSAPTGATAVAGNATATVSWTASASNGGLAITGYTVTAAPGGATCTTAATQCTVTGLANGTSYTFTVVATNGVGPSAPSAPTAAVTPATTPGAPTGVSGVRGSGQVTVSWVAPASTGGSAITGYTVTAAPGGATCTTPGPTTCVVSGLTNGTAYTFTVTATNAVGTGPVSTPSAAVTPATVPGAPTAVSAVPGNAQATVSWTAPVSNGGAAITGYTVTASPGGATCTWSGTSCTVTGLTNGAAYTFTVTATNDVGTGPASAPSAAVTPVVPTDCGPGKVGPFTDVSGTHPFCLDIEWLADTGVTTGFPDGSFKPSAAVTRQSMAAFLYRFDGSPAFTPPATASFTDVPTSHPFFKEIEWLASTGVTTGFPDGTFRPGSAVTRQSMAAFLYRFGGSPAFTPPATASFSDVPKAHPFFKEIEWLASTGVTTGYADGTFKPSASVTRQSMAAFLHRFDALGLV